MPAPASPLNNLPVWAQTVAWIGVPSLVAMLLLWFLIQSVSAGIEVLKSQHGEMGYYTYRICVNTAPTSADRTACQPHTKESQSQ